MFCNKTTELWMSVLIPGTSYTDELKIVLEKNKIMEIK